MEATELVLKELDIIQSIIARQEEMRLQSRNWYITIVTALTVALFSKDVALQRDSYWFINIALTILFLWIELIHRVAEDRAIKRSGEIEAVLRKEISYNGPLINNTFKKPNSLPEQWRALINIRLYSTYVFVLLVVTLIYFSNHSAIGETLTPPAKKLAPK